MELEVKTIMDTGIKIVPVPSEKLKKGSLISDYTHIKDEDNNNMKIIDLFTYVKGTIHPKTLFKIATGKYLSAKEVWRTYRRSDAIYFLVCEKID